MGKEKSWQFQVPAAAVIPEWLALFVMIGCKGCIGGKVCLKTKFLNLNFKCKKNIARVYIKN